ncbi:MAG: hypothetical protein RAP03_17170, partial [Candidatus Electryonea clarkiae]|nr:hypothetical protein [Candidatus Electryonea clarkiae]
MKKHILNSVIVICLSFFVVFIAIGSVQSKPYTYKLDGVYSISPDGILSLISEDAEIVIKGSDRTDVHIVVRKEYNISGLFVAHENEPFEMDIEEDDGNIIMREVGGIFNTVGIMTIMREEYEISIDIPTGVSLKLRGEDDNYLIENVNGNISLRIEDGRARLKQCNGEQFNIEIEDGNVE